MNLAQTTKVIAEYAGGLDNANAHVAAECLRMIASFLGEFSDTQMSSLVLRGSKINADLGASEGPAADKLSCAQVSKQIEFLIRALEAAGAKTALVKDLQSLAKLLRKFGESEQISVVLAKLRKAMKPEPVEQQIGDFIKRLKDERGSELFDRTFSELSSSSLKREHVVAIAISVYGPIKKGASRKAALEYIRKPHDAYVSAKRGIDATGGRSAA